MNFNQKRFILCNPLHKVYDKNKIKLAAFSCNSNKDRGGRENYIKNVPEEKRSPILVFSGKDLTEVQEDLLKERVVGLVKKDDVSMENLSKMIANIHNIFNAFLERF